jgi:hypothetical protein
MLTGGQGEVPGITMRQRQNVAMIAMAGYFSAYRRFLKAEAEVTLEQVQKFYMDDRVIRIGGQYDGQAVQLSQWKDELLLPYDLIVDENPRNPNTQEQQFNSLVQAGILPALFKSGGILKMPALVDTFPLAPKAKQEMKQWMMAMAQSQQEDQGKGKARDNPEVIASSVEHRKAQTALAGAKTQETLAKARALDKATEHKKFQLILDQMAKSLEHELSQREHHLNVVSAHHKMKTDMISALGSLNGSSGASA